MSAPKSDRNAQFVAEYYAGATLREIAARYGVTRQCVGFVVKRDAERRPYLGLAHYFAHGVPGYPPPTLHEPPEEPESRCSRVFGMAGLAPSIKADLYAETKHAFKRPKYPIRTPKPFAFLKEK